MANENRRTGPRVPANFKVDYIHKGNYIISFNKNISVDGMFISTNRPVKVGSHLKLVFAINPREEVEVPAIVVWVNTNGRLGDHGMGVQFLTTLSPSLKQEIIRMVDRVAVLEKEARIPT